MLRVMEKRDALPGNAPCHCFPTSSRAHPLHESPAHSRFISIRLYLGVSLAGRQSMSISPSCPPRVVPAQLAFLAIYNPTLGPTEETFREQLVFWYSRAAQEARAASKKSGRYETAGEDALREEENEKLRQIGLAQGMVDFAKYECHPPSRVLTGEKRMAEYAVRSFSGGESVDNIETDKSRIVLHELERGWWILAVRAKHMCRVSGRV